MPQLEKTALSLCGEHVLDVGAAVGCHALWLQEHHHHVTAVEQSPGACDVMRQRGVRTVSETDFMQLKPEPHFDTVLFMMNGLGMGCTPEGTTALLRHAAAFLKEGGSIIGDTSDIAYFIDDDLKKKGELLLPPFDHYYGKVHFQLQWKNLKTDFDWIYPDPHLLEYCALEAGLHMKIIAEGPHYDYLITFTAQR